MKKFIEKLIKDWLHTMLVILGCMSVVLIAKYVALLFGIHILE